MIDSKYLHSIINTTLLNLQILTRCPWIQENYKTFAASCQTPFTK